MEKPNIPMIHKHAIYSDELAEITAMIHARLSALEAKVDAMESDAVVSSEPDPDETT